MLDPNVQTQEEDLSNDFNNPPEKTYDLFGQLVDLQTFKGAYQKGTRGAVPFNPAVHERAQSIIRFYIQPLPEINVRYTDQLTYESANWADWANVTWPSLTVLGIVDYHEISNMWFRFSRVSNGKTYVKGDGTTGEEKTWKMIAVYADEAACRAAYLAAGGVPSNGNGANGHNAPVAIVDPEQGRKTALEFLKVIVKNGAKSASSWTEAEEAISKAIAQYPDLVGQYYTVESKETQELISEINPELIPF